MSKDYYEILGVSKTASADEIKTAFRQKAHKYHPDVAGGDAEKFKEINEAYQTLGNAQKRQQYDQFGAAGPGMGGFGGAGGQGAGFGGFNGFQGGFQNVDFDDMGDLFGGLGDIFGFGSSSRSGARRATRGRDLELNLSLEFSEAVFGLEKDISFSKDCPCAHCGGSGAEPGSKVETCPTCHGSGRVTRIQRTILGNVQAQAVCETCGGEGKLYSQKCSHCGGRGLERRPVDLKVRIPAGIDDGESIRLSGQGEAGEKGTPAGDLYLRVKVKKSRKFQRDGFDIHTEERIGVKQAILGDKIEIETVHGPVMLKIPEGTQSGTVFKIKDKGVPRLNSRGQGDQYVRVTVDIPKSLSKKQRQVLEELDI